MAITDFLPEIRKPTEKRLSFKEKLKWTLIVLIAFFVLSAIPLYGLSKNALSQFEYLSIILGANFGSIVSLGIGPIVTASIVLQLLRGSGLMNLDTTTHEGRMRFQSLQKTLTIFFIIFESFIYVFMGGLEPSVALSPADFMLMRFFLVFQLFVGGMLILYMDEVINKWGFGSGVSLFIAAGVSGQLMIKAFSPLTSAGTLALFTIQPAVGKVWVLFSSLVAQRTIQAALAIAAIVGTVITFVLAVYGQAMKVEIPLSFGRIRGHGVRWPLNFIYTSNIPVILISALMANMQLWARLMDNWGYTFLSNIVPWMQAPNAGQGGLTGLIIENGFLLGYKPYLQAVVYMLILIVGAVIFSIFWVQTAGMDARSQANQIMASGLQVPGFRRDQRVLESILNRYIWPLTIMGGASIGFLAAIADIMGALVHGTGILLTVMIIYNLYQEIAKQHMYDMYPALRKMIGGNK
jgi:preprotein translocase subunit SecY